MLASESSSSPPQPGAPGAPKRPTSCASSRASTPSPLPSRAQEALSRPSPPSIDSPSQIEVEEEVVAAAAEELVGTALVQQRVVAAEAREPIGAVAATVDQQILAPLPGQRVAAFATEQDDPGFLWEAAGAEFVCAAHPGNHDRVE